MTIQSAERTLDRRRLMKQLESWAQDIAPDTRDEGPAEAIVETRKIVLTIADMHIPVMHYCSETDDNNLFDYGDIHED